MLKIDYKQARAERMGSAYERTTNASVNGHSAQVLILASPIADVALYIGREKKGHKGIEGTPL
ncbi:hypothetical protein, partial [Bacteroides caecimuris]|uniref:hypothetical protein n=1 Tax=Bacteroides caecimuris TaxID=1796613 RepID=UPI0025AF695B